MKSGRDIEGEKIPYILFINIIMINSVQQSLSRISIPRISHKSQVTSGTNLEQCSIANSPTGIFLCNEAISIKKRYGGFVYVTDHDNSKSVDVVEQ